MDVNKAPEEEQQMKAEDKEKQTVEFDPSRMIGIIKRKALIKDLAAAYHAECVSYCKELLQLQKNWEKQQYAERRIRDGSEKQRTRPSKRQKKGL
ncbi:uncharacterized protein LOC109819687 isoform X2 [Asparagus officinalis]|uniref:uncharacterized protein LOC109819687 isoform X2 n=1 Tax=Asparagus officinalis TaxID=4686 RepID=UPI00098E73C8|nr:uncharacterized protein LOC109819687 isoform X2 [Asparagus officinalis]